MRDDASIRERLRQLLLLATLLCQVGLLTVYAASGDVLVARFGAGDLSGWEGRSFAGETVYRPREGGLCAESRASASGLFRQIRIDLQQTPILHWSWKVDRGLPPADERSKPGDDYAARIYVVFSGGVRFWRTRAINYVWSAAEHPGATWPNAFTASAQMVAVQGAQAPVGVWRHESRDVRADLLRLFGVDIRYADAVAIMSDTDNGGGRTAACYGDIWFQAAPREGPREGGTAKPAPG